MDGSELLLTSLYGKSPIQGFIHPRCVFIVHVANTSIIFQQYVSFPQTKPIGSTYVWFICLHLLEFYGLHVGKYTSPMDPMGNMT